MSLKIGSTSIGSLYLGSTKIAQAYLGNVKVYGDTPAPAYETYFDFGNTYTLSSATAASIDLTGTSLSSASKPYIVLYMDTTITAAGEGFSGMEVLYLNASYESGVTRFSMGGSFFSPGLFVKVGTNTKKTISSTGTDISKIKLIFTPAVAAPPFPGYSEKIQYFAGCWGATSPAPVSLGNSDTAYNLDPRLLTSISSPGGGTGSFSATNFKCAGFDTLNEAKAWMIE